MLHGCFLARVNVTWIHFLLNEPKECETFKKYFKVPFSSIKNTQLSYYVNIRKTSFFNNTQTYMTIYKHLSAYDWQCYAFRFHVMLFILYI